MPSMEPAVQYATTRDGVSIAWTEAGHGPTMLFCTFTPFTLCGISSWSIAT